MFTFLSPESHVNIKQTHISKVYIVSIPLINVKTTAIWDVTPSHLQTGTNILEEDAASIFRANASST
jgi:hypothetical protein